MRMGHTALSALHEYDKASYCRVVFGDVKHAAGNAKHGISRGFENDKSDHTGTGEAAILVENNFRQVQDSQEFINIIARLTYRLPPLILASLC